MPTGSISTPPSDDDIIEVLANHGEIVPVSRKAMLISPVFRDAFLIDLFSTTLSSNTVAETKQEAVERNKDGRIRIEADALAIRWLFGLLENLKPAEIDDSYKVTPETRTPPSPVPLLEAVSLADQFDIPFYPALLDNALWDVSRTSPQLAITVYTVAYVLNDVVLAREAVQRMSPLVNPSLWDLQTAKLMLWQPWWSLCAAFRAENWLKADDSSTFKWLGVSHCLVILPMGADHIQSHLLSAKIIEQLHRTL
ncbi:hypothetical protein FFLO_04589 [Filobasidium floriforme]|uniref:Uncharacterized protein n=1 Tax=Filobasidium floriforme TaxID=5210 RepID=A0A8K0NPQ4_9TREE|nr:uncharacterized protein HD553DRAFT_83762 [Filobasidium floriforme]KAG7531095.1 hypothetical protein FFLO_04589 [Filobasidium floriforme]KAH8081529.1 hypothetical protein HD553DRAFT_83762 [Filobasidium floriforme]